jgi:hypothetical protein
VFKHPHSLARQLSLETWLLRIKSYACISRIVMHGVHNAERSYLSQPIDTEYLTTICAPCIFSFSVHTASGKNHPPVVIANRPPAAARVPQFANGRTAFTPPAANRAHLA